MRKPIIAGNWKLYKTVSEATAMLTELCQAPLPENIEVVVCPVFTALYAAREVLVGSPVKLGAQDTYWEDQGAFTGEVSPALLKDVGCEYVIVGHSERRQYFAETDETVNKKTKAVLAAGLTPIVCVGETLVEREAGNTETVIVRQVKGSLAGLTPQQAAALVIAYEPVWAIGTGKTASAEDAGQGCSLIRRTVAELFGEEAASRVRIQYGGSVKPGNIAELMGQADIDGALVGGASLEAETFRKIICY